MLFKTYEVRSMDLLFSIKAQLARVDNYGNLEFVLNQSVVACFAKWDYYQEKDEEGKGG